jgi:transposase
VYLQATVQVVWARRGQTPCIKLDPSRASTHFYGALNLMRGQELAMRSPIMNAETSALFLAKILEAYPDLPILLLWDRATWHRGPEIKAVLEAHPRLEIMYFPAAAPDLNPQEHVWKVTRGAISHNHTCKKLDQLADDFEDHLTSNTFFCSLLETYGYLRLCMMFN